MIYNQQEYEMVRRQTMQIEAEKRALLRYTLIGASLLLALSLAALGWIYKRYSTGESRVETARRQLAASETELTRVKSELREKTAILEKSAEEKAKADQAVSLLVPKVLGRTASDAEVAELAHAIFQMPGHVITLPSIPPDNILRRYRLRKDDRPYSYILVAGLIDGRWVLYSNLVKNRED